jgi:putative transposase
VRTAARSSPSGVWSKEGELEVVERDKEAKGFKALSKRWIVERTFGWLRRDRRLTKDYERKVQTSETLIEVAMIRLILRRLARAA